MRANWFEQHCGGPQEEDKQRRGTASRIARVRESGNNIATSHRRETLRNSVPTQACPHSARELL